MNFMLFGSQVTQQASSEGDTGRFSFSSNNSVKIYQKLFFPREPLKGPGGAILWKKNHVSKISGQWTFESITLASFWEKFMKTTFGVFLF